MSCTLFLFVCSARALSNGWKSRVSPNSGNYIAKSKGVHREAESERSQRQYFNDNRDNFLTENNMAISSFYSAHIVSHCLYCRIKPGKGCRVFWSKSLSWISVEIESEKGK